MLNTRPWRHGCCRVCGRESRRQTVRAAWPQAFLGEIYMWGVALAFAAVGWRYNAMLLIQCVMVSYGVSLLLRAVAGARR